MRPLHAYTTARTAIGVGGRRAPSGRPATERDERHRAAGRPEPHAQPAAQQPRRVGRPPRDRARQMQLNPAIGNDGHDPAERRAEREDTERLRRQPSRRDDRDHEERAFARQIGERFVRDQQRAARFRVWKRCFVHRKRFSLSRACRGVVIAVYAAGVPVLRAPMRGGKDLGTVLSTSELTTDMVGSTFFAGVALLTLVAPFELTAPLLRLPRQSVSNLEAAVLCAFVCGAAALAWSRRLPEWRTPLTPPWMALLARDGRRVGASRRSRGVNAFHMTGRIAAAFGVYLLASTASRRPRGCGRRSRWRSRSAWSSACSRSSSTAACASVLDGLKAFRPAVSTVGAQVRAGGPLQYPTIASMYLEVVFAFGLGVMLAELDGGAPRARRGAVRRAGR